MLLDSLWELLEQAAGLPGGTAPLFPLAWARVNTSRVAERGRDGEEVLLENHSFEMGPETSMGMLTFVLIVLSGASC